MDRFPPALVATLLIACAPAAFAASSTDVSVTGLITPSACTPSLSGGGAVDHGKISVVDLKPGSHTYFYKTLQMAVNCDAATLFALSPIDNRPGTTTHSTYFGLGLTNTNEKLGHFRVIPRNVMADNVAAQAILSRDGGQTWLKEGSTVFWGLDNIWGIGATGNASTPIPVKDLALDILVSTGIAPGNSLPSTDEMSIDGAATLEVTYL